MAEIKLSEKQPDNQNQEFVLDTALKGEIENLPVEDKQELPLENVNLEDYSEGASKDKLIAEKVQDKEKNVELIIAEDIQQLPLEIADSDIKPEETLTDNSVAEKDQSNQFITEINNSVEKKDNKIEESETRPVSKSEVAEAYVQRKESSNIQNLNKNDEKN